MTITEHPANPNNYTAGREGASVDMVVLHTMQGYLTGTDAWFANAASKVSSHYGIGLNGEVHRYVDETNIAWHAGDWSVNMRSVGIEFEDNNNPFKVTRTDAQLASAAALIWDICTRHGIPCERSRIRKHNEVSTTHPNCPGNLDADHVVGLAAAYGLPPAPVVAPPLPVPPINAPWTVHPLDAMVEVLIPVLNTRTTPHVLPNNLARGIDGLPLQFRKGIVHVTGWVVGDNVTIGDKTSNVWLRSEGGHFAAEAGTNANYGALKPSQLVHFKASNIFGSGLKLSNKVIRRNK